MTFEKMGKISKALVRFGTVMMLVLAVGGAIAPKPLDSLLWGYALWFALGVLLNNMWARWLVRLAALEQKDSRRKAWLEATKKP